MSTRKNLRAAPAQSASRIGDHALAALESFNMAGLASCHPATVERGIRELRALIAVARAAEREIASWRRVYGRNNVNPKHPLFRALDRLKRVSRGGR